MGILSLLCLMCGPIPWLMIALADTAEMPFSQRQHTNIQHAGNDGGADDDFLAILGHATRFFSE